MLKRKAKFLALAMALALVGSVFAGCQGKTGASKSDQVIKYNLGAEPKTIDPGLNNSVEGGSIIVNNFEGLLSVDDKEQPIAGVAEKWEASKDGLTYTFHLRKDAKWSDGKPVTAKDFEYAWKRALNPDTASEYASQLFYIKNGEAYNNSKNPKATKKATEADLGIKVVDDHTLVVTLEGPCPYFLSLMSFPTYMPLRKDVVEKDPKAWATKPETYIGNGPFMMKEWKPKDVMVFAKNTNYWNAKSIKLEKLQVKLLNQESSYLSAFKTGELDFIESPPQQEIPQLLKDGVAKFNPYLAVYFYHFNISENAAKMNPDAAKAIKDPKVRKALTIAIDRKQIVEQVTKGGQTPATSFIPSGIKESGDKSFKTKEYYKPTADVETAKKLLAEAGYPDGKGFPEMEIMYNTMQGHQNIAQAIQDMWKKNLGINTKLRNVERKVHQDQLQKHEFVIARNGWTADYQDPMTFLGILATGDGNNNSGYSNPEFDKKLQAAKMEADPTKRMAILHEAEDIAMNDLPILPIYEYTNIICVKDYVKNVHKSPLGFVYFNNSYVEKKK